MLPQIFNKKTADSSGFPFNQFDEETFMRRICAPTWDIMQRTATINSVPHLLKGMQECGKSHS